jgi:hypothetical protein
MIRSIMKARTDREGAKVEHVPGSAGSCVEDGAIAS